MSQFHSIPFSDKLLLDNSSTHKGTAIEQFLDKHPRLRIEYFPSYAPQLSPDEGV